MVAPPEVAFGPLLLAGIAFMVLVAGGFLFFLVTYQKRLLSHQGQLRATDALHRQQLLAAIIEAQEVERERIGQDLHDSIGSTVATAKMLVSRLRDDPPPPNAHELLPLVEELMVAAVHDVRSISRNLYPTLLSRFGLAEAIWHLVTVSNEIRKMHVSLEVCYPQPLALAQELALYRICQELVANSLKHARGATHLTVRLHQQGPQLTLAVEDNGCGFAAGVSPGVGLRSIGLRVQMLRAQLSQHSVPGQGTHTEVLLLALDAPASEVLN